MKKILKKLALLAILFFGIYIYFEYWSIALQIFVFLLMFCFVGTFPICRKCESTWIYVLTLFVSLSFNIRIAVFVLGMKMAEVLEVNGFNLFYLIVLCMALTSVEELIFGVIARIIWRRQQVVIKKEKTKEKVCDFSKL